MQPIRCKQFLIGLPGAGKTTYLAALWHVVTTEFDGALRLKRLSGDQGYLHRIRDLWADVNQLERTKPAHEQVVAMLLEKPGGDSSTEVILPDLSGESFAIQWWGDREITLEHDLLLQDSVGGLLLIHPDRVREETMIVEAEPMVSRVQATLSDQDSDALAPNAIVTETAQHAPLAPWVPEMAPTQVQLVELLQFVAARNTVRPMRLGVIVSAWDRVAEAAGPAVTPMGWVSERLPLLEQYLSANPETFTTAFFGVSAQGGGLDNAEKLRTVIRPTDRIIVVGESSLDRHDVSGPVSWVMA